MPKITMPGYSLNQIQLYSGLYTMIFSGVRDQDQTNVVVKILKSEHPSPEDIARFRHEYEIAKDFENETDIVHVSALEKHDNSYAIVMENIHSPTLDEILKKEKKLDVEHFLELAIRMTEALGHIHQHNIIHKDINPSNIMYDMIKKEIKIIDFGLSANLPKERAEIVSPNVLEGTLTYLSPEQTGRMNRGIDYRTDYYSLGVTFYHMLTGQLPFISKDPMELVHFHIAVVPKSPHEIDKNIPKVISDIVMKLLAKKAEDRYQNANGLLADLKECQDQWKKTGKIISFPLGRKDVFSRFQIPEKLYGREKEVEILMNTYKQVSVGKVQYLLVSGYSGIGKSALVHEVHKPIVQQHGYFISGKFDQFKHNIPYAAVTQAFDEFVKQILTESEDRIASFRKKILNAVGENGKIITDVIPNLESIVGEQKPVPELGPTESQNRFSYVFQNFIKALAAAEHPLVIFLDDLQWADQPSLKLLEMLLTSPDCQYIFIIGAYRSNEVSPAHALMLSLEELKKRNIVFNTIELGPLDRNHVTEMLADTLHQEKTAVQPLAEICYEKTGGNPFFLIQLFLTLSKKQHIEFDAQHNQWVWDIAEIKEISIAENVVQLMINKLRELNPATLNALKFSACIGNQFNLNLLASICKKDPETVLIELQEALKEGYIISHGEAYRAVQYHFAHDRIQQAAHSMIDDNERKLIHINLARLILEKTRKENLDEAIFDIANHYNTGISPIIPNYIDKEEKRKIAELNLIACKSAKSAAAYEPAQKYIEFGLKCIEQDEWKINYQFMLDFYNEATESAYLSAKFDVMEKYAQTALANVRTILDKLNIIQTQVYANVAQVKQRNAIDIVTNVLGQLGLSLPKKPNLFHVLIAILKIKFLLLGKKIENLLFLPEMTNNNKKNIMVLLNTIYGAAYQANQELFPLLVCESVISSLRYGNTKESSYAYAAFGIILCGVLLDIDNGYRFGDLSLKLVEKLHHADTKTRVTMVVYVFVKHWKDHIRTVIPALIENFNRGLDMGDLEHACYSVSGAVNSSIYAGISLKNLTKEIEIYKARIINVGQAVSNYYIAIFEQAILNMIEQHEDPGLLTGTAFDENKVIPILKAANERLSLLWIYSHKLWLYYLFERYEDAFQQIKYGDQYEDAAVAMFTIPAFHLYRALTLLSVYANKDTKQQRKIFKEINKSQNKIAKWSKYCPANNLQKYYLIEAERAWRIDGKTEKATKLYDQAIAAAKDNEFLNEEALANELAAKYYLAHGNEKIARVYMEDARHCYLLWGADAKVAFLDKNYSQLLGRSASAAGPYISTTVSTAASDRSVSQVLDISTMQKSSQAISSTIVLADLLKRLMRIVIENAGAQKSYLLLKKKKKFVIEAEGNVDQAEAEVLQSIELKPDNLPLSIINYVIHSKEAVVLDNASRSERFMNDTYIVDKQPKSVLCMPLLNQGVLTGILYMENNLTEGAFTQDRTNVLTMLSSQIAISIDNARLYSNTKALNEQLIILNNAYERFVPQDFLSLLQKKSIVDVALGDQVQETMSVLFTDIRNFTTISESMSPEDNFKFINSFLSIMAPVIRKYNGFVDKYIGDAIMALYPKDADDAVQCALEMQQSLKDYNRARADKGLEPIGIGIGINTGLLMLGTVGETNRMNATVISDTVNIASRIESLTKSYQVPILISEDTYKNLKNPARYQIEMVDNQVLVKGKTKPIAVYKVKII